MILTTSMTTIIHLVAQEALLVRSSRNFPITTKFLQMLALDPALDTLYFFLRMF
jgi:hypothetical protein